MTDDWDFSLLEQIWSARRQAMRSRLARIDPRGMTRPARDPDERAWLAERGEGTFIESDEAAELARAYYARKYGPRP